MYSNVNIKITTLNVRGMVSKSKREKILLWMKRHKVDIACLQETHCTKHKLSLFQNSWKGLSVYGLSNSSHSRGVGILFSEKLDVKLDNFTSLNDGRAILVNVVINQKEFVIVNCYAPNEESERIKWFGNLVHWVNKNATNLNNLIVCGDLNCCLGINDRSTSSHTNDKSRSVLSNIIQELNLKDYWDNREKSTSNFTWSDGKVQSRLDYILVSKNNELKVKKIYSETVIDERLGSRVTDHRTVSVECDLTTLAKGPGYWKMNTQILSSEDYHKQIKLLINDIKRNDKNLSPTFQWEYFKIKVKEISIKFSTKRAKKNKDEMLLLEKELNTICSKNNINRIDRLRKIEIQKLLNIFYDEKTKGSQIRARTDVIEKGEANVKYFDLLESFRQSSNVISSLQLSDGNKTDNNGQILAEMSKIKVGAKNHEITTQFKYHIHINSI